LECYIPTRGSVIRKRSEAAVVGGSKLFDRQELKRPGDSKRESEIMQS
jgi:hypothetical protein